jgi:phosphoribosylanthranilate isomerase
MVEVKICGITTPADARSAVDCGVDALGFIFYPKSPRYIDPAGAKIIMDQIPGHIIRVGVFVNQPAEEIGAVAAFCCLHLIQLHGDESPLFCRQFPADRVIKAFSLREEGDIGKIRAYPTRGVLIDSRSLGIYGGTGKKADWGLARKAGEIQPLMLAGGLGEKNVSEAIRSVSPRALDLNSCLESSPGKKDPRKIKRVMDIIHSLQPANPAAGTNSLFGPDLIRE